MYINGKCHRVNKRQEIANACLSYLFFPFLFPLHNLIIPMSLLYPHSNSECVFPGSLCLFSPFLRSGMCLGMLSQQEKTAFLQDQPVSWVKVY